MSYGEKLILTGMVIGACTVILLAGPSWWARGNRIDDLSRRLTWYRKNWK